MRLEHKAARIVFPRLGSNMPPPVPVEADFDRFRRMRDAHSFGGLVLFNGAMATTPALLDRLQADSDVRLLVAADIERGAGQQMAGATLFPHAQAFTRLGDDAEAAVEAFGAATAREARAAGIHIVFGPVADVNRDPRNPIIGTRAFGSDTARATALVTAYIRGCRREGLLTTAKHFPGHGNTHADSHAELPVVTDDEATLVRHDLAPFRAAIAAGVELVMTAHVAYPALDRSGAPATVSRPILHDLLRTRLGFQGAVITDSLIMGAVRERYATEADRAAALLNAGVDIVLDPWDPPGAVAGIVAAVQAGRVTEARLDEAIARIESLRGQIRPAPGPVTPDEVAAHAALADRVARQALFSRRLHDGPIRRDGTGEVWILLNPFARTGQPPEARPIQPLARLLESVPGATYIEMGPDDREQRYEMARHAAEGAGVVVVAMIVKPAAWHAFGLPPRMVALAASVFASRPAVLAVLGSPQMLDVFPDAAAHVCVYSNVPVAQQAAADHIRNAYLHA
ncbi:MAG: glycoside hydrolase family 3 N-terminal domain-containing protein [Rhodothermales bacterium]|nr:glycoside hydrolase family 3 N-terminal domain-containing protein [Rhodothermales bacterium]